MKHSILIFIMTGLCFMLFSCTESNITDPENRQFDQLIALEKMKTPVKATADIAKGISPGIKNVLPNGKVHLKGIEVRYNMNSSDPLLLSGALLWNTNKIVSADAWSAKIWGKMELFVGIIPGNTNYGEAVGKWEMTFHGYKKGKCVILDVVGQGIKGNVKGMVGKWTYNMILPSDPTLKHFDIEGYISIPK